MEDEIFILGLIAGQNISKAFLRHMYTTVWERNMDNATNWIINRLDTIKVLEVKWRKNKKRFRVE